MNLIFIPFQMEPFLRPLYYQASYFTKTHNTLNKMFFYSFSFPLQPLLITLFLLSSHVFSSSNQPNETLTSSTMDRFELETLFTIMETLSTDHNWRLVYPNPCEPGSSWIGIACKITGPNNNYHVTRLDIGTPPNPSCKKTATFPSQIFQLPYLESIFIFQCFTQLPTRILIPINPTFLSNSPLQQLSLRSNPGLIDTIPPQISSLKSLQILTLSQNKLTGQIPSQIFRLTNLLHLDLSYNMLTGQIPFQVGNLKILVGLDLSYNKLSGPIPSPIGQLKNLQKLDLSSDSLTGTIPGSIQNLNSLVFLALSNNKLTGYTFPGNLTGLKNLEYFLMDDNPMFISLPVEFGNLKRLQELRLSNSGYSGRIPTSYSGLTNLSTLSLQNNRLSGEIPVGFRNLSRMYHLNLSRNLLNGVVPFDSSFLKRLGRNLDLSGNPGLCLSPSEGSDGPNVGAYVCGSGTNGPWNKPMKISEAPVSSFSVFRFINVFWFVLFI